MILLRPNGMVEPLYRSAWERPDLMTYGRVQPGPATAEAVRLAARQDRRKERRARPEPLRGRLVDVEA